MHSYPFPIQVDHSRREIRVGRWIAESIYYNHPSRETDFYLKDKILLANGIPLVADYLPGSESIVKLKHQQSAKYLGPKFYKRLRGVSMGLWINPIKDLLDRYCFYSTGKSHYYNIPQIQRLWNHLPLVEQLEVDQLHHLVPLTIFFCASPKILRRLLGKSIWKRLSANSLSRNKLLVSLMERDLITRRRFISTPRNIEPYRQYLSTMSVIKSSLLKRHFLYELINKRDWNKRDDCMLWLNNHAKVSDYRSVDSLKSLYMDTYKLCEQTDNLMKDWSPKSMRERHDKMSREVSRHYLENISDTPFDWSGKLNIPELSEDGVKIEVLDSPFKMACESSDMCHCLSSYIDLSMEGSYFAFSLYSDLSRSTLGIVKQSNRYYLDQHYGAYNQTVKDQHLLKAATHIVKALATKNHKT